MASFSYPKLPTVYRTKEAYQLAQLLYNELSVSTDLMGDDDLIVGRKRKTLFSYVVTMTNEPETVIYQLGLQLGVVAILYCEELAPQHVMAICKSKEYAERIAMGAKIG